jgi:RNA polymerase sigma-70 factor (ECF subfamily)
MDRHLVDRMLAGDEGAFDEFFEMNFDRLFRFASRRLDDPAAAEDIAQATLVQALRKLHTWRGEAALFTWLCSICRRELMAYWTRTRTQPIPIDFEDSARAAAALDAIAGNADDPEVAAARKEVSALVQLTLDYLPGRYGDVLEWKYLRGESVHEIAQRLGVTPKAAESTLSRAREAFRVGFTSLSSAREAP